MDAGGSAAKGSAIGQEVAGSGPVILVAIFSFDPFS